MTMGELIKRKRTELELTQEELGKKLVPKVNRAAINKWETGQVENIKRIHIQQLSKIFGIRPSEVMCFDDKIDSAQLSDEVKTLEMVQKHFGKDAVQMIEIFQKLNSDGKTKVIEGVSDMIEMPKYTK